MPRAAQHNSPSEETAAMIFKRRAKVFYRKAKALERKEHQLAMNALSLFEKRVQAAIDEERTECAGVYE